MITGLIMCDDVRDLALQNILLGVLPLKIHNKLSFHLCSKCCEGKISRRLSFDFQYLILVINLQKRGGEIPAPAFERDSSDLYERLDLEGRTIRGKFTEPTPNFDIDQCSESAFRGKSVFVAKFLKHLEEMSDVKFERIIG